MIEGCVVEVQPGGGRKHPQGARVAVNTKNILFICGGSFEGIEKIVERRLNKKAQIGFGSETKNQYDNNTLQSQITVEDIRKFGMIPEMLGRLPVLVSLQELSIEALINIITKPKNNLYSQYQAKFELDGIELMITKGAFEEIAKKAIEMKTGARSLRTIMEGLLLDYMFVAPEKAMNEGLQKIQIDKDCVLKGKSAKMFYKQLA